MSDRENNVRVEALVHFIDQQFDERRKPAGPTKPEPDRWYTYEERAINLENANWVRRIDEDGTPLSEEYPWGEPLDSRFLETAHIPTGQWNRVVACLNIWNDREALEETWDTWYPYVDHVIAVDGAYRGAGLFTCGSTDGTLELLEQFDNVEIIHAPEDRFWKHQVEKRNKYFEVAEEDDLLFVVDADEFVENGEILHNLPEFDVGWVPYKKGIYQKEQNFPRLFSASIHPKYFGRHYWVEGEKGYITDGQYGGPDYDHMFIPLYIDNTQGDSLRSNERITDEKRIHLAQYERESKVGHDQPSGRESLRVVQLTSLDPGMVVFRFHSAINSTTPHESVMASTRHDRCYEDPYQWDAKENRDMLRRAVMECDLIHCHLSYDQLDSLGVPYNCPVVIHHHGTMYRRSPKQVNERDKRKADVRFVSNPELLQYGDNLHFLPNPVPVKRYRRMRDLLYEPNDEVLRVGHSPSKRWLKGTGDFLEVIQELQDEGINIESVLIENQTHAQSLRMKAAKCDVFFDSFWLGGIQCSGLEAGAMGIPVIGGDSDVRDFFDGDTPYLYANTKMELKDRLRRLHEDLRYRRKAGANIYKYVQNNHDYAAVTKRYVDILDDELNWRTKLSLGNHTFLRT